MDPKVTTLKNDGNLAFSGNDWETAIRCYLEALSHINTSDHSEFSSKLYSNLSASYLKSSETLHFDEKLQAVTNAVDNAELAIRCFPQWKKPYIRLAQALMASEERKGAAKALLKYQKAGGDLNADDEFLIKLMRECQYYETLPYSETLECWDQIIHVANVMVVSQHGASSWPTISHARASRENLYNPEGDASPRSIVVLPGVYDEMLPFASGKMQIIGNVKPGTTKTPAASESVVIHCTGKQTPIDQPIQPMICGVCSAEVVLQNLTLIPEQSRITLSHCLNIYEKSSFTLKNCTVKSAPNGNPVKTSLGTALGPDVSIKMENCDVHDMVGMQVQNGAYLEAENSRFWNISTAALIAQEQARMKVQGCTFTNCFQAVVSNRNVSDLVIADSKFDNCGNFGTPQTKGSCSPLTVAGLHFYGGGAVTDTVISGCTITNSPASGIAVEDGSRLHVSDTLIDRAKVVGIGFGPGARGGRVEKCTIQNCGDNPVTVLGGDKVVFVDNSPKHTSMPFVFAMNPQDVDLSKDPDVTSFVNPPFMKEFMQTDSVRKFANKHAKEFRKEARSSGMLVCKNCGKREDIANGGKLKVCQGCHMATYCNANCQRKHWKVHKKQCQLGKMGLKE